MSKTVSDKITYIHIDCDEKTKGERTLQKNVKK